jgi:hypothetical protein
MRTYARDKEGQFASTGGTGGGAGGGSSANSKDATTLDSGSKIASDAIPKMEKAVSEGYAGEGLDRYQKLKDVISETAQKLDPHAKILEKAAKSKTLDSATKDDAMMTAMSIRGWQKLRYPTTQDNIAFAQVRQMKDISDKLASVAAKLASQ